MSTLLMVDQVLIFAQHALFAGSSLSQGDKVGAFADVEYIQRWTNNAATQYHFDLKCAQESLCPVTIRQWSGLSRIRVSFWKAMALQHRRLVRSKYGDDNLVRRGWDSGLGRNRRARKVGIRSSYPLIRLSTGPALHRNGWCTSCQIGSRPQRLNVLKDNGARVGWAHLRLRWLRQRPGQKVSTLWGMDYSSP